MNSKTIDTQISTALTVLQWRRWNNMIDFMREVIAFATGGNDSGAWEVKKIQDGHYAFYFFGRWFSDFLLQIQKSDDCTGTTVSILLHQREAMGKIKEFKDMIVPAFTVFKCDKMHLVSYLLATFTYQEVCKTITTYKIKKKLYKTPPFHKMNTESRHMLSQIKGTLLYFGKTFMHKLDADRFMATLVDTIQENFIFNLSEPNFVMDFESGKFLGCYKWHDNEHSIHIYPGTVYCKFQLPGSGLTVAVPSLCNRPDIEIAVGHLLSIAIHDEKMISFLCQCLQQIVEGGESPWLSYLMMYSQKYSSFDAVCLLRSRFF